MPLTQLPRKPRSPKRPSPPPAEEPTDKAESSESEPLAPEEELRLEQKLNHVFTRSDEKLDLRLTLSRDMPLRVRFTGRVTLRLEQAGEQKVFTSEPNRESSRYEGDETFDGCAGSYSITVSLLEDEAFGASFEEPFSIVFLKAPDEAPAALSPDPAADKTVNQVLTIPYGAELSVTETENDAYQTTVKIGNGGASAGLTAALTAAQTAADQTVTFTNTERVKLSVTKTVTGDMGDHTLPFTFTLSGLTSGQKYPYARYTSTDGTTWTPASGPEAAGELTADKGKTVTFTLKYCEKIVFTLPAKTKVTVSETNRQYTASYVIDGGEIKQGSSTGSITLNGDTSAAFTDSLDAVSPTGYRAVTAPFALMLGAGLMLLLLRRKRRPRRNCTD